MNSKIVTKLVLIISIIGLNFNGAKAQYVAIPDTAFVTWLAQNYPACMSGNLMDTTCADILTTTQLYFDSTSIANLDGVQYFDSLIALACIQDLSLITIPSLPNSLTGFSLYYCPLSTLPPLPNSLNVLQLNGIPITTLPALPNNLHSLSMIGCLTTSIGSLPNSLQYIDCNGNQLISLPTLPSNLFQLYCSYNQLTSLPILPDSLGEIDCSFNQLTSLTNLPDSLVALIADNNLLQGLPQLPSTLLTLHCSDNPQIFCLPTLPPYISDIELYNTNITCLPNYTMYMDSSFLSSPLCLPNDTINNPHGCVIPGILGSTYQDINTNCFFDSLENTNYNIIINIYDSLNAFLAQSNSLTNGFYDFPFPYGTYHVMLDTLNKPYTVTCLQPGIDSTVTLTAANPLATNINFPITCKPGFDIGVQSVVTSGWVFPGQTHEVEINAGDISQWFGLNCSSGISGTVQVAVSGPVSYIGASVGALTPSVNANTFIYNINDFGAINNTTAFGLLFTTDTTAQAGDAICVLVNVTPTAGDNNASNNTYNYCYQVFNSYDPNIKEVYPTNVPPGYSDWLTYTIHFQNSGSASAFNIRLIDTLDTNLDLNTFEVINYSHSNTFHLTGNVLDVRFNNIQLPDSTTDEGGSHGSIQYRIKPKANQPLGTQIKNTAYIYFDFNPAIVTNTTVNSFTTGISGSLLQASRLELYPNPTTGIITIKSSEKIKTIEVYNLMGELILTQNNATVIDIINQPNGIYFVKTDNGQRVKIVKQ